MRAGEICNRDVVIVEPHASLREVALLMREYHVGALVVVDQSSGNARPVGIVTDRDIVIALLAADVDMTSLTVRDVIASELLSANSNEDLWVAAARMSDRGVRRLPVIDNTGVLIGILSLDDLIERMAEYMNSLAGLIRRGQRRERRRPAARHG
jgi:CBS domain-containing protein